MPYKSKLVDPAGQKSNTLNPDLVKYALQTRLECQAHFPMGGPASSKWSNYSVDQINPDPIGQSTVQLKICQF